MQELWKILCSPRHLMVFEAAARRGSFTLAAQELNVQQPAISATIKQLEDRLGIPLFTRSHRKVVLTAAGERLFADATRAFDQLTYSAMAIRHLTRGEYVTLNASSAFNMFWMMPRLPKLQALHPDIDLRLQSSDREPDIDAENISLAVRRGDGQWQGCDSALIADEVIYPVASPKHAERMQRVSSHAELLDLRLIHLEEPIRERPGWQDWFSNFQSSPKRIDHGLRFNDYALVLQAAMAGEGCAFGWKHVTDRLIEQGLLVGRPDMAWKTGKGFYLVWSSNRELSEGAERIRSGILSAAGRL